MNAVAELVNRQFEAAALKLEDRIAGKTTLLEAVRRASADYADLICKMIEEDAAEDAKLAQSLRAGDSVLPPASQLQEGCPPQLLVVNADEVVDDRQEAA